MRKNCVSKALFWGIALSFGTSALMAENLRPAATNETVSVQIENPSFEPSGASDEVVTDFSKVPGWTNAGLIPGVKPWKELFTTAVVFKWYWLVSGKAVDANYALYVQGYSRQVWQTLKETVRDNSTYTVSINVLRDKWKDAEKTKFQIQLVTFNGEQGDFSNATVLAEQEFSNISQDNFQTCTMTYTPKAEHVGKPITVCLRSYYERPSATSKDLAWKDTGVSVDKISMTCETK